MEKKLDGKTKLSSVLLKKSWDELVLKVDREGKLNEVKAN